MHHTGVLVKTVAGIRVYFVPKSASGRRTHPAAAIGARNQLTGVGARPNITAEQALTLS